MNPFASLRSGAALLAAPLLLGTAAAAGGPPARIQSTPAGAAFIVVAGDTLWLTETLEVLGSRVPAALPGVVRQVEVLDEADLAELPGRSTPELLQLLPAVVTGQRGAAGSQSDLTIRGSTFEQVQVLLDGVDVGDPQTGHHLLDLPLGREDVSRLEVLPGHGSALYGSGAFGGTVNVIPRPPRRRNGGELSATLGGLETRGFRAMAELGCPCRDSAGWVSLGNLASEGPAGAGTDFDQWTAAGRLGSTGGGGRTEVTAGFADRRFGAPGFYAPYPSWEHTRTLFAAVRHNRSLGERLTVEPGVFVRRHEDRFVLLRDAPEVYTNEHETAKAGAGLRGVLDLGGRHALAVGLEGALETIDSRGLRSGLWGPALGEHERRRASLAAELDRHRGPVRWQLGGRLDLRDGFRQRLSATAALAAELRPGLELRGSAGTVYRVPTFTELYYASPSDLGNPDLRPEEGWSWDGGLEWHAGGWSARAAWFGRSERDLIEWTRPVGADTSPWMVRNVATGEVRGVETAAAWRHGRGHVLEAGWMWLEKTTSLPAGYAGKYALLTPRQVLTGRGTAVLPGHLSLTLTGRYLERSGGPDAFRVAFVLDGRLDWRHRAGWFAGLAGSNLLNRRIEEVPGVALPRAVATVTVGRRF